MTPDLAGRTVLIVEDEALVAMLLEDLLLELGCVPAGMALHLEDALIAAEGPAPDLAILDVNVCGQAVFPVAERLAARGVPLVFASGYGQAGLPPAWRARPMLVKPYTLDHLERAVREALQPASV